MIKFKKDFSYIFSMFFLSSAVFVGGILGYLFQVLSGRFLGLEFYGSFVAFLSISTLLVGSLKSLFLYVTNVNSKLFSKKKYFEIFQNFLKNLKSLIVFIIIIFILIFFTKNYSNFFFKINNNNINYLFFLYFSLSLFYSFINSYLQSFLRFKVISMNIIIENGLRIVFLLLFLKNGLTLLEALLIIILSSLAVNLIAVYRVKEIFFIKLKKNSIVNASNIVDVRYLLTLFLANLMLSLLINFDMIFVNYFFSQEKASIFAATAVVGKAIIYISSAITISLFPVSSASKTNSDKSIFYKSLLFVLFLNFISIFFYFLFGEFLIELLYGKQFKFSGHLLGYYALAIMPISLIFVAEHYFLAKKILVFVIVLILFIPIGIICMFIFANNLMSVIYIIAIIGYSTVLFGTFIYAIQKNKM